MGEPKPLGAAWRRLDLSFLLLASLGASSPPPSSRAVAGARACFLALRRSWITKGSGGIDKGVGGGGGIDGVGGGGPAHRRQWLGTLTLAQLTGLSLGVPTPPRAVGCALRRHRSRAWELGRRPDCTLTMLPLRLARKHLSRHGRASARSLLRGCWCRCRCCARGHRLGSLALEVRSLGSQRLQQELLLCLERSRLL